ncbi:MAG: adenylyltransferase/cytidyltransferase family protein [Candidatus Aminicenantes bacterium]|nr:adenylyltransferase/cytidyltransferase family protein [Candidatus Aminicenantes bacterium]
MKICLDINDLNRRLDRLTGKKIVFTNGVFDILHPGHIELLEFAGKSGDCLIVGINDDDSVKRLNKGEGRPIFPLGERMKVLAAIEFVDYIIPFSQDTPLALINGLSRVDVLVKGGDYKPDEVVGRESVEQAGGKLLLFEFKSGYSTSSLVEKVKSL